MFVVVRDMSIVHTMIVISMLKDALGLSCFLVHRLLSPDFPCLCHLFLCHLSMEYSRTLLFPIYSVSVCHCVVVSVLHITVGMLPRS